MLKEIKVSDEQPVVPEVMEKKIPKIQYVSIILADGRKGIFAGPEFISSAELTLAPPRLVSIDFSQPREYPTQQPQPEVKISEETKIEEVKSDSTESPTQPS